jgi:hypothetical protein
LYLWLAENEDIAMRLIITLAPLMLLAGCGAEPTTNSVDTVSPAEAEALNDAAEMLDQTEPPPRLTNDTGAAPSPPMPAK